MLHGGFHEESSDWIYSYRDCTESDPEIRIKLTEFDTWSFFVEKIKNCMQHAAYCLNGPHQKNSVILNPSSFDDRAL